MRNSRGRLVIKAGDRCRGRSLIISAAIRPAIVAYFRAEPARDPHLRPGRGKNGACPADRAPLDLISVRFTRRRAASKYSGGRPGNLFSPAERERKVFFINSGLITLRPPREIICCSPRNITRGGYSTQIPGAMRPANISGRVFGKMPGKTGGSQLDEASGWCN